MLNATPGNTGQLPRYVQRYALLIRRYAFELVVIGFILFTCVSRGLRVGVSIHDPEDIVAEQSALSYSSISPFQFSLPKLGDIFAFSVVASEEIISFTPSPDALAALNERQTATSVPVATSVAHEHVNAIDIKAPAAPGYDDFNSVAVTDDPAPHLSNLTLVLSPDYGVRKGLDPEIIKAKKARVQRYLNAFAAAAQDEMREYGIPASITLAQGLLESNAGDSKLARQSNNHFGIKCRSKCLGCTCRNYGDDTRYDMFRVFDSVADSFREHSILLNSKRYAKLKKHGMDYQKWAHGLKSCGYATDKRYAHKLIKIIENLELDQYDEAVAA
ncbi:mannosyl-glycoprotein endo-beta-N-acetylglucosamidase [Lewinellaceae bacterium SD302]|nr:mannosyl-glycoprotein endo-beta-N-acetylglucosamidase [Lewinellaceae bacterium SD302]